MFRSVRSQASKPFRSRLTALVRRIGEVYLQVFRVYRAWWMYILPLAFVIVVPVDVLDSLVSNRIRDLGSGHLEEYVVLATIASGLSWTSLVGQIFMAGVIGLSLIHARHGRPPSLGWMARNIRYWQLIAVDFLYIVVVTLGTILLVIPGVLALVLFSLVGTVLEIEGRGIRAAFIRSFRLVRRDFWLVFWVLATVQLGGVLIGQSLQPLARAIVGEETIIDSIAQAAASIVLEPFVAVAIVLLTLRLAGQAIPAVARGEAGGDLPRV